MRRKTQKEPACVPICCNKSATRQRQQYVLDATTVAAHGDAAQVLLSLGERFITFLVPSLGEEVSIMVEVACK